jgi:alpha-mannosidase
MVIATSREMFEEFERRYGDRLPVVRGDFTPYWEDGAASTAREVALNRASGNRLLQAETLYALRAPGITPFADLAEAWRQVILWDEHTWGAADSVSDPDGENARTQWAYKQAFALEADKRSKAILDNAIAPAKSRSAPAGEAIEVANTHSWGVTDLVLVPAALSRGGDRVEDEQGRPAASQRLSSGELAILAEHVPGFGSRRYAIRPGEPLAGGRARAAGTRLDNGTLYLELDPDDGAVQTLKWMGAGNIDLVDTSSGRGLNEYLYVPGKDPGRARGAGPVRITVGERGPLVASLIVESGAPGARTLSREVRVTSGLDRADFIDRIDKTPVRTKESIHIAFPFRVPGGQVRLDLGWGVIRPDLDQIDGSCRDFFALHSAADVSNGHTGLTWISLDAPLAEIGRMTDETPRANGLRVWRTEAGRSQTIYSYAMNNYWHTNSKADQEGPSLFRYAVVPHGRYSAADMAKRGLEASQPLLVAAVGPGPVAAPLISVRSTRVIATSLVPLPGSGEALLRLYNPSDVEGSAEISVRGRPPAGPVRLAPRETRPVRLAIGPALD